MLERTFLECKKIETVVISKKKIILKCNIVLKGKVITQVSELKYFRVITTSDVRCMTETN